SEPQLMCFPFVEKPERVIVGSDKLQPSDQADLDLN
ncbi:plasmid replication initiation protein, partial [Yersinia pseudotuberculosis]